MGSVHNRVLSCKDLHNDDYIQNIFLFHSRDCRYYAEKARGAALKIENGVICCWGFYRVNICRTFFIQNTLLLHSWDCQYYQCKETVITAEKKSILHLKNGAKSALGERERSCRLLGEKGT